MITCSGSYLAATLALPGDRQRRRRLPAGGRRELRSRRRRDVAISERMDATGESFVQPAAPSRERFDSGETAATPGERFRTTRRQSCRCTAPVERNCNGRLAVAEVERRTERI